ncbi:MAG TPA: S41 family peptidase [Phycisphaerae bacterium]|nr:S41 family peptidase [Phycisphaerae bacterium]
MTILAMYLGVCLAAATGMAQPATAPSVDTAAHADALAKLMNGNFRQGHQLLVLAGEGEGAAARYVAHYLQAQDRAEAEGKAEYADAVARVNLARIAQAHRKELEAGKLDEKLFDAINDVADDVDAATRELKIDPTSRPAEISGSACGYLDKSAEKLAKAVAMVGPEHGQWGEAFQEEAEGLRKALQTCRGEWAGVVLPRDWLRMRIACERVQDRLIDVGVLVSKDPLASALNHAREAKEVSLLTPAEFVKASWVKELMAEAKARGDKLISEGKWDDALSIYGHGGLSELAADPMEYDEQVQRIGLHVRMLNLYGPREEPGKPATAPAQGANGDEDSEDEGEEPRWHEMIRGIDVKMIRQAIAQVDNHYVDRPDYRAACIGALRGIKVLLETQKAVASFPSLQDESKRLAMLRTVDQLMDRTRREPTVDHLHVRAAHTELLDANARTVNIPSEVVNMEFTEAMLEELDKFTSMIWPYEDDEFKKRTLGSFCGIGVQIRKEKGKPLEVVTPLADSPALKAGIRAGDLITQVDGRNTRNITVDRAVKLITGKAGHKVSIQVSRPGMAKPFDVDITREEIHIRTVKGWRRLPETGGQWDYFIDPAHKIGYIRLTQFTGETTEELRSALKALRRAGATGLILDMRFNPGGLLSSAVEVADEFLRQGLIVRTEGRKVAAEQRSADPLGEYQTGRLVVLTNQYSASAAEIVSGALKDWSRATIVGVRTYGKGSVQRLIPLQPNRPAKLKLTTAYYYLPSGKCLHRTPGATTWGVDPHIEVPMTIRQMNRAAEIRLETGLVKDTDPARLSELLGLQLQEDIQLQTALLVLRLNALDGARD